MAVFTNACVATCRHDNDHINIQDISIAPTQQEVLSQLPPYLPPNRPGTVMHLEQGSQEAHKDLHFRYASTSNLLIIITGHMHALALADCPPSHEAK